MRRPLLLVAAVALVAALGACSDDDGDATTASTTTSTTTTTAAPSSSEAEADEPTTTEGDEPDVPVAEDLAARLPAEIEGYERGEGESENAFGDELCDGSAPSVLPAEGASADYLPAGDELDSFLGIFGYRFASDEEAGTFYDEFASTTAGCEDEGLTVDGGADSGIGDQGRRFGLDFGSDGGGALYASLVGDEVWLLSSFGEGDVPEAAVEAFTTAVEG
jgi:hypothetical protein